MVCILSTNTKVPQKIAVVENNTLGKDKIYDINPMLKIGIEDADGDPLKGGGGVAKSTNGSMLGQNGVKTASKTIWKGVGKERIDVENPNPGQRPGQLHYQDNKGNKYIYDPQTNSFPDAPKSVNNLLNDPSFKKAIDKGMFQYLGEKK